jgi:hypothetical protein
MKCGKQVDPVWFRVEIDNLGSTSRTVSGSLTGKLSGRNAERSECKGDVNGKRFAVPAEGCLDV